MDMERRLHDVASSESLVEIFPVFEYNRNKIVHFYLLHKVNFTFNKEQSENKYE